MMFERNIHNTCINKIYTNYGKVSKYVIQDMPGCKPVEYDAEDLRRMMMSGKIVVSNLKIDRRGKIVSTSYEEALGDFSDTTKHEKKLEEKFFKWLNRLFADYNDKGWVYLSIDDKERNYLRIKFTCNGLMTEYYLKYDISKLEETLAPTVKVYPVAITLGTQEKYKTYAYSESTTKKLDGVITNKIYFTFNLLKPSKKQLTSFITYLCQIADSIQDGHVSNELETKLINQILSQTYAKQLFELTKSKLPTQKEIKAMAQTIKESLSVFIVNGLGPASFFIVLLIIAVVTEDVNTFKEFIQNDYCVLSSIGTIGMIITGMLLHNADSFGTGYSADISKECNSFAEAVQYIMRNAD